MTGPVPDEAGVGAVDDSSTEPAATDSSPRPDRSSALDESRLAWERIDWIACAVLVLASIVLVSLHVRTYTTLSPTDELQHLDYVIKAGDLDPPRRNDIVGQEAMAEAACRSVDAPGYIGPLCGADVYDPEDFQENGVNTAAGQFPFYYTVTGVAARGLTDTGILSSPVTAARMVGSLWAGAAWAVLWYVMSLLGIARLQRGIAIALFMATPLTLFHASTVNADTALLLTGSLVLLATLQFERGRLHGGLLLATFAGLYLVEATNVLPITAAAGYLLLRSAQRREHSWWRWAVPVVGILLVVALRFELASALRDAWLPASPRTLRPTMFTGRPADFVLDWGFILDQFGSTFTPLNRTYLPPLLRESSTRMLLDITDWLSVAALVWVALYPPTVDRRIIDLARLAVPALLVAGPFYSWSFAYFSNIEFSAQGRFGLPLFGFIVVVLAASLRPRAATVVAGTVAAISMFNTVFLVLTP